MISDDTVWSTGVALINYHAPYSETVMEITIFGSDEMMIIFMSSDLYSNYLDMFILGHFMYIRSVCHNKCVKEYCALTDLMTLGKKRRLCTAKR